ncbi:hypothetical protein KBX18_08105 [Corynebacterium sp. CCUG 69979]|uniref:hypothetical protein n=1 Tax=Corynebacterium sp. CCUG 69979 TaxID=2823890 RepID=UPI002109BB9C|nr:hypothetical protein [Corynebacterium sp. CCUG 69979]MCQ4625514.1 hypothetical protein [Corynebacterium sp. CCUG 69979]
MHYVSWDRTDRDAPKLLAEAGPETLAEFTHDSATLSDGSTWTLISTPEAGAKATVAETGQEIVSAPASLKRDKQIPVMIGDEPYTLIAESSKNWIIDDANGNKVAQFTSDHNGVRRSVLEFDTSSELAHPSSPADPDSQTALPLDHIVGLAWVSRLVLEYRKMVNTTALIGLMVFLSVFVVAVWLLIP